MGAKFLIRGPGGIGKTAIAQSIINHSEIKSTFMNRLHFVDCSAIEDGQALIHSIASSLQLIVPSNSPLNSLQNALKDNSTPRFLILDNAETFWYSEVRKEVSTIPSRFLQFQVLPF